MKPIEYANKLIKKYKTICPFELADYQNIIVRYEDLPSHIKGMTVKALRRRYILLNYENSNEWNRFVCAHELGHHNMHPGHSYQFIMDSLFVLDKYERQANEFAVHLLLFNENFENYETTYDILRENGIPYEMERFIIK